MGGVRLVPRKWENAQLKIHPACPVGDEEYDVFYVDEDEFNSDTYSEYAARSKTDWFWSLIVTMSSMVSCCMFLRPTNRNIFMCLRFPDI